MVTRRRKILIVALFISALIFGISGLTLIVKGNDQVFVISSEYFSGDTNDIKFFKLNNSIILVSPTEHCTQIDKITKFDPSSAMLTTLYNSQDNNIKYIDAYVQNDNFFLVSLGDPLVDDENNIVVDEEYNIVLAAKVEKYDAKFDYISSVNILSASIEKTGRFAVDEYENYFILNTIKGNVKIIEKYDSDGKKIAELQSNFNIISLSKTLSGQIIANTHDGDAIVLVSQSSENLIEYELAEYSFDAPVLPVNFIDKDLIIDSNSNVYKLGNTLEFIYSSETGNNVACKYGDNILVACENTLLLLDDSGFPISQFNLQHTPDLLIENNKTISCFNFSEVTEGKIIVEVINSEPSELQYQEFTHSDSVFVAEPTENSYTVDEINAYTEWTVSFDTKSVNLEAQENISVKIKALNSETDIIYEDLTIDNNSIRFLPPEDLSVGVYSIIISGIRTSNGKPALCKYSITVKENPTTTTTATTTKATKATTSSTNSSSKFSKATTSSTSKSSATSVTSSTISSSVTSSISETTKAVSTKIESSLYTIDRANNIILGIEPGTTLAQFKKNITYTGTIYAVKNTGVSIKSGKVGTGTKIYLRNGDKELDCLTIVIKGDLTGEGNINSNDMQQAYNYLLGEDNLDEYALLAFDLINEDGNIDLSDLIVLNRLANGIQKS